MKRLASFTLIAICLATPSSADQLVRATWYGNELRGHRTASGETFNPAGRTAAHKSLPFGTCLMIGNPKTGRKVAVPHE
jgi:peptidoglycan lytic transglycosylase